MLVRCGPLYDGQEPPPGGWCGRVYDDADRWTLCPHPDLGDPHALVEMKEHDEADPNHWSTWTTAAEAPSSDDPARVD